MFIDLTNICAIQGLKMLTDGSVDLIVTDPPYKTISGGSGPAKGGHARPGGMLSKNDGKIFKHNEIKFQEYFSELYRVLKDPAHIYIMTNWLNLRRAMNLLEEVGFKIHCELTWKKQNATPSRFYMKNKEHVIFARKGAAFSINNKGSMNCHEFKNPIGNKRHETEKPVDLLKMYIENSSQPGDTVLDPFVGSGSTAQACHETGRNFIGFEIDPKYYQVCCDRLAIYDPDIMFQRNHSNLNLLS